MSNITLRGSRHALFWPAVVLAVAVLAAVFLPRYEWTDRGRLDRWTGELCRYAETGEDPWAKPGAEPRLVCTR